MIPLWLQVVIALGLDRLFGDPRWFPHPVLALGRLARTVEEPLRQRFSARRAGVWAVTVVIAISVAVVTLICTLSALISPLLGDLVSILLIYLAVAMQDLNKHALAVYHPLTAGDLNDARSQVQMLVGRDTDQLDESEVTRAAVESIAENTVDGVTAPLIFALLAGAPGAWFYKAVNTLDSNFGYKNERYLDFGWAAAKFDDLINFIPARITALLVPLAAKLIGLDSRGAWRIFRRDRHRHPSPNGGQIESTMAGALGVRLGGENSYFGKKSFRDYMGDAVETLQAGHILKVTRLMTATSLCVLGGGVLLSVIF